MLKKLSLLVMAVAAMVAFSASAAQADEWYTDIGEEEVTVGIGTENADHVTFTGSLASTAGNLRNGPCAVEATVDVWNEEFEDGSVTGAGKVTVFDIAEPCQIFANLGEGFIPLPGCQIENASSNTETPWPITVLAETQIAIHGANFTNQNSKGCEEFEVPLLVGAGGTATGQAVHKTAQTCIVFNESGDLETPTGVPVKIDGEVCAPNLTLK